MICVLDGGTGGGKFVDGLRQVSARRRKHGTLVVNTGWSDLLCGGLYVSPDIDSDYFTYCPGCSAASADGA